MLEVWNWISQFGLNWGGGWGRGHFPRKPHWCHSWDFPPFVSTVIDNDLRGKEAKTKLAFVFNLNHEAAADLFVMKENNKTGLKTRSDCPHTRVRCHPWRHMGPFGSSRCHCAFVGSCYRQMLLPDSAGWATGAAERKHQAQSSFSSTAVRSLNSRQAGFHIRNLTSDTGLFNRRTVIHKKDFPFSNWALRRLAMLKCLAVKKTATIIIVIKAKKPQQQNSNGLIDKNPSKKEEQSVPALGVSMKIN